MKRNIAVIAGGNSGEHDISIQSGYNIVDKLDKLLFNVYFIHLQEKKWDYISPNNEIYPIDKNDFSLKIKDKHIYFDCVFIAIHGNPGEDGKLQGYFDMIGIPYVGCDAAVSALTFNKNLCNKFLAAHRIHMAESIHLFKYDRFSVDTIIKKIGLPCFVKPCNSGSSVGVSKVNTKQELLPAIQNAFLHDNQLIIERFVKGREITCGVMSIRGKIEVLAITEVISKNTFFDLEAKYNPNLAEEITPAKIDNTTKKQCETISKNIYNYLGCKGIVRVDYIYNEKELCFIEINTIPGQTNESIIPKQIRYKKLNFTDLCTIFIEEAIERK